MKLLSNIIKSRLNVCYNVSSNIRNKNNGKIDRWYLLRISDLRFESACQVMTVENLRPVKIGLLRKHVSSSEINRGTYLIEELITLKETSSQWTHFRNNQVYSDNLSQSIGYLSFHTRFVTLTRFVWLLCRFSLVLSGVEYFSHLPKQQISYHGTSSLNTRSLTAFHPQESVSWA